MARSPVFKALAFGAVMMREAGNLVDFLMYRWEHATPTDFGALAMAVCVTAWFISRYYND